MSTKGVKLNTVPIFQNKELIRFVRGKNLNLPELTQLLIAVKSFSNNQPKKCELTEHSKRVLSEIKYINKVITNPNSNNENDQYGNVIKLKKNVKLKEGVSVLKINQGNVGYKFPIKRKVLLDKLENNAGIKKNVNIVNNSENSRTINKNKIDFPDISLYYSQPKGNNIINKRNFPKSERNGKRLKEVDMSGVLPDNFKTLREKKEYLLQLNTKYFSQLSKYFK